MEKLLQKIYEIGIVPVIKIDSAEDAAPLAKALCNGGLPCAEVTFRTEACVEAIKEMKKNCPEILLGAGTVSTIEQVVEAVEAGAEFIVTPGFNPEVIEYCVKNNILVLPGCSSASDMERALKYNLEVVKVFPAESIGGIKLIKSLAAPYSKMKFMPTGGINKDNLREYLSFDKIVACGGTWMVPNELVKNKDFIGIEKLVKNAVEEMLDFELAHIGLNTETDEEALKVVNPFEKLFGFKKAENPNSIFAGKYIEAMRSPYLGEKGHIGIFTKDIERAVAYLKRMGISFNEESKKYNPQGKLGAIYLEDEIGKFAVHLVQK